jgi:Ca2+-binding EF-hand superfamily protein
MTRDKLRPLLVALALAGPGFAAAQQTATYDVEAVFAESDTNKDGRIELDEFHARLTEIYFHGDANKDGYLSAEEFRKAVVIQEDIAGPDRDRDGRLSLREFMASRLPLFAKSDTDQDSALSLDEVKAALAVGSP